MKKLFVLLLAFFTMGQCLKAQETLDTWSVYDVDMDTKVSVQDVTKVVNRAMDNDANDQQVVDAAQLNAVLQAINEKLQKLDQIESRLEALEAKICNCAGGGSSTDPDPTDDHEYVDLGLSVKWATCNVGAEKPEDAGLYFAWGETEGYTADTSDGRLFNWANYKWMDHTINNWNGCTKYTCKDDQTSGIWYSDGTYIGTTVDGKLYWNLTTLLPEDDAATVNWGGTWRMPTASELLELQEECEWTWNPAKKGYVVASKTNGNHIFIPVTGLRTGGEIHNVGLGHYWTSSLNELFSDWAGNFYISSVKADWYDASREYGLCIRPVHP